LARVALLCFCLAAASALRRGQATGTDVVYSAFLKYQTDFNKVYTSIPEHDQRFAAFSQTVERVERMNKAHGSNIYGLNKFSDMTQAEFKQSHLGYKRSPVRAEPLIMDKPVQAAPTSFDWRTKNAVTAVKDQGQCGSCWAFSVTEELESMWFLSGKNIPTLAPQQIVSCDTVDQGCNGGDTVTGYAYVKKAGGQEAEASYPYTATDSKCKFSASKVVSTISAFKYATPPCNDSCNSQDETTLAANLASTGPVSICVYAESWQDYTGGVLKSNCPHDISSLDHCVQLVGYVGASSTDAASNYWLVRNSWGADWGEAGYIWVEMGKNLCGVADEATIAIV